MVRSLKNKIVAMAKELELLADELEKIDDIHGGSHTEEEALLDCLWRAYDELLDAQNYIH